MSTEADNSPVEAVQDQSPVEPVPPVAVESDEGAAIVTVSEEAMPESGEAAKSDDAENGSESAPPLEEKSEENEKAPDLNEIIPRLEDILKREEELLKNTQLQLKEKQQLLKGLLGEWNEISDVNHKKVVKLKERFTQIASELKNELDWERWANSKQKEKLCLEAENLKNCTDESQLGNLVKDLQAKWKEVGASFREDETLWNRFKSACDEAFERAREYYKLMEEKRTVATAEKAVILEKVEILVESEDWKATADELSSIQEKWKELGPASRAKQKEYEKRFSKACNTFFKRRREHFRVIDEQKQGNLEQKNQLCEKAEYWQDKEDWERSLSEIKKLQQSWKSIGPVPHADSDAVWKRFNAACDKVFSKRKDANEKNLQELKENLEKKEKLCQEFQDSLADSPLDVLKKTVDDFEQNFKDIGHVSRSDMSAIQKKYRATMDAYKAKCQAEAQKREEQQGSNCERKVEILDSLDLILETRENADQVDELKKAFKGVGSSSSEDTLKKRFKATSKLLGKDPEKDADAIASELQQNAESKEYVCYKLENLAGIEPPPVDEKLKKQWMVAELSAKMGKGAKKSNSKEEEVNELYKEWISIGAAGKEKSAALKERYNTAMEKLKA